jgi:hypothetical protein
VSGIEIGRGSASALGHRRCRRVCLPHAGALSLHHQTGGCFPETPHVAGGTNWKSDEKLKEIGERFRITDATVSPASPKLELKAGEDHQLKQMINRLKDFLGGVKC